jgi:hypothetical protein
VRITLLSNSTARNNPRFSSSSDDPHVTAAFDPRTRVATGVLRAMAKAPLTRLARTLDPQNWSTSPFFLETRKVVRTPRGYERDPAPPPLGLGWRGLLFERFLWQVGPLHVCRFTNVLNVDYRVGEKRLNLTYSMHCPLGGNVWFSPTPLGLDVDSGYLHAGAGPDGVEITLLKKVRMVELGEPSRAESHTSVFREILNNSLPGALRYWLATVTAPWLS